MNAENQTSAKTSSKLENKNSMYLRKYSVPLNKQKSLKNSWAELIKPLVKQMQLAVKYNYKTNCILLLPAWALKASKPEDENELAQSEARITKALEYLKAYFHGFKIEDCLAILRLDDIFLQSFRVTDVKKLENDNLCRAIGRITGKKGRTKTIIENSTRTRIVICGKEIHLLGSYENIALARDSICNLILGSKPTKVHNHLSVVNRKMKECI